MCEILGRTGGDKYLRDVDISVERIKEIRIFGRCWNIFQVFLLPMWVRPLRQLQCETSWGNDYPLLSLCNKVRNHFLDQNQQMWCDYTWKKNFNCLRVASAQWRSERHRLANHQESNQIRWKIFESLICKPLSDLPVLGNTKRYIQICRM